MAQLLSPEDESTSNMPQGRNKEECEPLAVLSIVTDPKGFFDKSTIGNPAKY